MELARSTTAALPTIWGYATLTTTRHRALPCATTQRVDTVLAPVLTPDELEDLHDRLDARPRRWWGRTPLLLGASRSARHALSHAIDVRTTTVLQCPPDHPGHGSPVARLLRTMVVVEAAPLTVTGEALARELLWAGLCAARVGETDSVLRAAGALRGLTAANRPDLRSLAEDS
ncbi:MULTISPECIES: hypothetical protein [Cellulosimicrobium]|jgi:hypothetical protein|uniref:Uncharacterized protein n=1 Tax=Cellulosimicrobium sp. ES-005 TaxID=3163031 RepID=A0AAU8FXP9_9MICO|nr:hypothetical protein [Cellulosimicrobium cellulans]MCO7275083.1 hypothetical protein [Cellulosimicrobium cellulans]